MKLKFLASLFLTLGFTFWPLTVANANPLGLQVEVYSYDPLTLPNQQPYTLCTNSPKFVANIDLTATDDVVANCQADFVLIHYSGFLVSPKTGDVYFTSFSDDGFRMSLDDTTIFDAWKVQGCSSESTVTELIAGRAYKFDAWWFEYAGQACNRLFWGLIDPVIVPETAFYRQDDPVTPIDPVEPPKPPVEPIDPIPEVVTPEPTPEPSSEPLEPVLPTIPEIPEPTLDDLMTLAQQDDIQVPEALADIPLLGETAVAVINAINFVGNVGADMRPQVRKQAQETLVSAVIVTQVAQLSTQTAMNAAQASISAGSPQNRRGKL
jgi:hypothetical protein